MSREEQKYKERKAKKFFTDKHCWSIGNDQHVLPMRQCYNFLADCSPITKGEQQKHFDLLVGKAATVNFFVINSAEAEAKKNEKEFNELARNWKKQTAHFSTLFHVVTNSYYLKIIADGHKYLPFILKDFQKSPEHWHEALRLITKQNPVNKEDLTDMDKIRETWLGWGKKRGLIA